ncbi:MAG: hypothetical protein JXM69_14820 [Anaerolineae bacterium]|nr:hypothetical protein [Anaerolineae bacterium]
MFEIWRKNIWQNLEIVRQNDGPALATIVSGNETDKAFWQEHLTRNRRDVFRADGKTLIHSVCEGVRKGNFLGTFNAWLDTKQAIGPSIELPQVALMSMVFGKGKRLSPFTQALGNRKPAFLTPMRARASQRAKDAGAYIRTVDLSNLYANLWLQHLRQNGFGGLVVKWGDEAIIPGKRWSQEKYDYRQVDAVRFVWKTKVTETLAREKEWIAIDGQTGTMKFQYARQDINSLQQRLGQLAGDAQEVGVNLGSLAISYDFLEVALAILRDDLLDPQRWVDWDPYAWIALCCRDEAQWQAEMAHEDKIGKTGIRDLLRIFPDFYPRMAQLRQTLEAKTGRPLTISVLDFGEAFWTDMGLHVALRRNLESLTVDSPDGAISRELFGIPHDRDPNGNIVVDSQLPAAADIRDSLIIDTIIEDKASVIHGGVVIGGRHRQLRMPEGGSALFCAVDKLTFSGPAGIAFRLIGSTFDIPAGGRYTTLFLPEGPETIVANESIIDFKGESYSQPILGNRLSFEEAGKMMEQMDGRELEARWLAAWQSRLS